MLRKAGSTGPFWIKVKEMEQFRGRGKGPRIFVLSLCAKVTCPAALAWNCPGPRWDSVRTEALLRSGHSSECPSPGILISFCTVTQSQLRLRQSGIFLTCPGGERQRFLPAQKEDVNPRSSVSNEVKTPPSLSPPNLTGRVTGQRF